MNQSRVAIIHYTAPPVIGGVEVVIAAHARLLRQHGHPVSVIAGRGAADALLPGVDFIPIPEADSQHPEIVRLNAELERGDVPADFDAMVTRLVQALKPVVQRFDHVMIHNVFTKHFNLPLTVALHQLLDTGDIRHGVAWCHDMTWTSEHSRSKVHPGYVWDLLRTPRSDVTYVTVSRQRQQALAELFNYSPDAIRVIYNGVDADTLWGVSPAGHALINRLEVLSADLILLMPVRITQAKNIELALHVIAVLLSRGCQARLIITGPPDPHDAQPLAYFHALRKLRAQLKVEHAVRFVAELSTNDGQPLIIDEQRVAELYRISDLVFMPSHREGFGLPILEAGLVGVPVVCTEMPAAQEIGGEDVLWFDASDAPEVVADLILTWAQRSARYRLRRRVRQNYTWSALYQREIEPLLTDERVRAI
ncbi:MAG: glycosyltransferase family 4 protein [Anaerolineae bacterium]